MPAAPKKPRAKALTPPSASLRARFSGIPPPEPPSTTAKWFDPSSGSNTTPMVSPLTSLRLTRSPAHRASVVYEREPKESVPNPEGVCDRRHPPSRRGAVDPRAKGVCQSASDDANYRENVASRTPACSHPIAKGGRFKHEQADVCYTDRTPCCGGSRSPLMSQCHISL